LNQAGQPGINNNFNQITPPNNIVRPGQPGQFNQIGHPPHPIAQQESLQTQ
jgi:hypothetical protein